MGRKAGGKNFGNFTEASTATTVEQELSAGIIVLNGKLIL